MKKENEQIIMWKKVQRIVSLIGMSGAVFGMVLEFFDGGDYLLFILLLISNLLFFINTLSNKS